MLRGMYVETSFAHEGQRTGSVSPMRTRDVMSIIGVVASPVSAVADAMKTSPILIIFTGFTRSIKEPTIGAENKALIVIADIANPITVGPIPRSAMMSGARVFIVTINSMPIVVAPRHSNIIARALISDAFSVTKCRG